jgi:nucleoside phosphorylase
VGEIDVQAHKSELENNYWLVLTSNSVEKDAVKKVTTKSLGARIRQDTDGAYLGLVGGMLTLHLSGHSGVSTDRSIGRVATAFLRNSNMPKPRGVILLGFCWRNPKTVPIDGLILSNEVLCANVQHAKDGTLAPQISRQMSTVELDLQQRDRLRADLKSAGVGAYIGPIASAETLYKDSALRDKLTADHPELLGGEMEAFAFVSREFPWLVMKAASDSGGDDFNRDSQMRAASLAANALVPLLQSLERDGLFSREDSRRAVALRDQIEGLEVVFEADNYSLEELNDVLNARIGAQLEFKMKRYAAPAAYAGPFPRHVVDALLELTQNAVRYGKANRVTISFLREKIVLRDNGHEFDPRVLDVDRKSGGARAIRRLLSHERDGLMSFSAEYRKKGNTYVLELPAVVKDLEKARSDCRIRIRGGTIGVPYGRPVIFEFGVGCTTLYLDTTSMRMSSSKYVIAGEIRRLLEEGKTIYVGCGDEDDVALYQEELHEFLGQRVFVFLDGRSA